MLSALPFKIRIYFCRHPVCIFQQQGKKIFCSITLYLFACALHYLFVCGVPQFQKSKVKIGMPLFFATRLPFFCFDDAKLYTFFILVKYFIYFFRLFCIFLTNINFTTPSTRMRIHAHPYASHTYTHIRTHHTHTRTSVRIAHIHTHPYASHTYTHIRTHICALTIIRTHALSRVGRGVGKRKKLLFF